MGQRGNKRAPFGSTLPRSAKKAAGRTDVERTPLSIRMSGVDVTEELKRYVHARMGAKLGAVADRIERLTVRFDDVNGPRGGVDKKCRIKVVLAGLDSVVYESSGVDAREAMDRAANGTQRAVRKALDRSSARAPSPSRAREVSAPEAGAPRPSGGAPSKRRDAFVDTAAPGVSASERRAGGGSTARRNAKRNTARATSALEDSAKDRPSRKSTRKSANRAKRDSNLKRRQTRATTSPKARARRAQAKKR